MREIEKPTIAGVILPEWVLALQTIVDILAGGLTISQILRRNSKGKVSTQETRIHGDKIIQINRVKNLKIIVNESRKKSKQKRNRKKDS
jgi:hypothetical protein